MRAIQLFGDRDVRLTTLPDPAPPAPGEAQIRIRTVGLNHLDVWGFRGMAFAKRQLPLSVAAEAAGEITAVGEGVTHLKPGQRVVPFGALTCGTCRACQQGRDNLCENVGGVRGFHVDGFAQELTNHPARLLVPVPDAVSTADAACVTVAYGTVEHMLFDNAKLEPGETILVHAGGSAIGSIAIRIAKSLGCTVITTVGSEAKAEKAKALGADHVINYRQDRFEGVVRRLTAKKGVDVVFEHVGVDTWAGSMFSLRRGGTLVTCGSTTGISTEINLFQLYQQQLRLIGSFGCRMENIAHALAKIAGGVVSPVIDSVATLDNLDDALQRIESRQVFGKIIVML